MRYLLLAAALVISLGCGPTTAQDAGPPDGDPSDDPQLAQIELPPGFRIELYASVPNARAMRLSPNGTLFVGSRRDGTVHAVVDADGDYRADRVVQIAEDLQMPTGLALHDGDLYVSEVSQIVRLDDIESRLDSPPQPVVAVDGLPSDRHHGWKFIDFSPDGKLFVPVGAPCNICDEPEPYASILRMNPDGTDREVYAHGVRNSVGFDWHPETGVFWFTDNGRDNIGVSMASAGMIPDGDATAVTDSLPPCELNRAPEPGLHFGYPYVHGDDVMDPEFGQDKRPDDYVAPALELGPHVAPLGMEFYTGDSFPADYRHQIFIAEHGSWNRTEKIGYRVMLVRVDEAGNAVSYEPFATGWLQGDDAWGRPVDVEVMPDGSLLVSDDGRGAVYRIVYDGES